MYLLKILVILSENSLLDGYCGEAEDVLSIGFVLGVTVVFNLWLGGVVVCAGAFRDRS